VGTAARPSPPSTARKVALARAQGRPRSPTVRTNTASANSTSRKLSRSSTRSTDQNELPASAARAAGGSSESSGSAAVAAIWPMPPSTAARAARRRSLVMGVVPSGGVPSGPRWAGARGDVKADAG
jgi:hypothetical protein